MEISTKKTLFKIILFIIKIILVITFTILLYFSQYTIIIGIILSILIMSVFFKKILKFGFKNYYKEAIFLHDQKLKYKIDLNGMHIEGEEMNLFTSWSLLKNWQIKNDWLILTASSIPQLYFPVSLLKENKILTSLKLHLKQYAKEIKK